MKLYTLKSGLLLVVWFQVYCVYALDVVAVNPIKPEMAVCGNNQVLYILNSSDLTVTKRISLDFQANTKHPIFTYTSDGKFLIMHGLNSGLTIFESENYNFITRIEVFEKTYINNSKSLVITCDETNGFVRVYSLPQGFTQHEFYYEKNEVGLLESVGFTNQDTELVFCFQSLNSSANKLTLPAKWNEMSLLEQTVWTKKNDGLNSIFRTYNLKTNSWGSTVESWINPTGQFHLLNHNNQFYGVDANSISLIDSAQQVKTLYVDKNVIQTVTIDVSKKMIVALTTEGAVFFNLTIEKSNYIPFKTYFQKINNVYFYDNWAYFVTPNYRLAAISTDAGKKGIVHVF